MTTATDGYIRLSIDAVLSSPFMHALSVVDPGPGTGGPEAATSTSICGFTEWVAAVQPALSIGWDWILDTDVRPPRLRRLGLPRSNLMLVADSAKGDVGWDRNLQILATIADALPWQEQAKAHAFETADAATPQGAASAES